jgi:glycosyltransferase involved in cell wall biosynthesis
VVRRVAIVLENLPVPLERRTWMQAQSLRDAGYDVTVICPKGKGLDEPEELIDGIRVFRHDLVEATSMRGYLREYAQALVRERRLLRKIAREGPLDVIQLCNPPDVLFVVALWHKWRHGTRIVFDHHDLSPELFEVKFSRRGPLHWLLLVAERLTFSVADAVISTNESYRRIAIGRGKVDPDAVFVVLSSPDLSQFAPAPLLTDFRNGRRYLVGYVGVMAEQDGVDLLVRAADELVNQRSRRDIQFLLIGDGPAFDSLRALARSLELDEFVTFAGPLYGEPMRAALTSCDVAVVPDPKNPYNDKCTMCKVLEYMALGVPIVQFDLLENRVSAGNAAAYAQDNSPVSLAEMITHVLDRDPKLIECMRRLGQERVSQFDWQAQVPQLLAAYSHALE